LAEHRVFAFFLQTCFEFFLAYQRQSFGETDFYAGRRIRNPRAEIAFIGDLLKGPVGLDLRGFNDFHRAEGTGDYAVLAPDTFVPVDDHRVAFNGYRVGRTRALTRGILAVFALNRRTYPSGFYHKETRIKVIPVRVYLKYPRAFMGNHTAYHTRPAPDTPGGICFYKKVHAAPPPAHFAAAPLRIPANTAVFLSIPWKIRKNN
jgi:hypothetical protein